MANIDNFWKSKFSFFASSPLTSRFLLFCVLPIALLFVMLRGHLKSSVPITSGAYCVPGLQFPVEIFHDRHGIPAIYAKTDRDAYLALGFKHASDRLWQLEMQRRLAQGRLSEVLGPDTLEHDIWMRTLGLSDVAGAAIPFLDPDTIEALTAYADGVNTWISLAPSFPIEFQLLGLRPEPWTITDSLSLQKLFALILGGNMNDELQRVLLQARLKPGQMKYFYPHDPPVEIEKKSGSMAVDLAESMVYRGDLLVPFGIGHRFAGSNAWVVSGRHTQSGHPILANDPHLGLQLPSAWYAAELNGEKLSVSGMTLVGLPVVVMGQNSEIAWAGTSLMSDQQDLFVETTSPEYPSHYKVGSEWKPFDTKYETITIGTAPPFGLGDAFKPVKVAVRSTGRGPVISDATHTGDLIVSLRWAALDAKDQTMDAFFALQYAKNWSDFRGALAKLKAPGMNFLYADRSGNIGLQTAGMMPRRHHSGVLPVTDVDGSSWNGYHNFDSLPSAFNPEKGYIVNANNLVESDSKVIISHEWAPWARHDRISELLNDRIGAGRLMAAHDMQSIQADVVDLSALELVSVLKRTDQEAHLGRIALDKIEGWDGQFHKDSVGASIFSTWSYYIRRELFDVPLKSNWHRPEQENLLSSSIERVDWSQLAKILSTDSHGWCKSGQVSPCMKEMRNSLTKALAQLEKLTGSRDVSKWTWSSITSTELVHQPLGNVKGLEMFFKLEAQSVASPNSISASNLQFDEYKGFIQNFGSGFRQISELDDAGSQWYMVSTGQSGNIMSPHFSDMVQPFSDHKLIKKPEDRQSSEKLQLFPVGPGCS